MNSLERASIEKAGYANGWENVRESNAGLVVLFSARHKAEVYVTTDGNESGHWQLKFRNGPATDELARSLPEIHFKSGTVQANGEPELGKLLRRAAELATALPNQAAEHYAEELAKIDASPPNSTEALAWVKQRKGQDIYRQALMDYWGNACSVTGIALPELLRASHAKPWANCDTDAERLNVFNGFLLCAHLDALFDKGLMTFDDGGDPIFSTRLNQDLRDALSLTSELRLRWVAPDHLPFLTWHRKTLFQA